MKMYRVNLIGKTSIDVRNVVSSTKAMVTFIQPELNTEKREYKASNISIWFDNYERAYNYLKVRSDVRLKSAMSRCSAALENSEYVNNLRKPGLI